MNAKGSRVCVWTARMNIPCFERPVANITSGNLESAGGRTLILQKNSSDRNERKGESRLRMDGEDEHPLLRAAGGKHHLGQLGIRRRTHTDLAEKLFRSQ